MTQKIELPSLPDEGSYRDSKGYLYPVATMHPTCAHTENYVTKPQCNLWK